MGDTEEGEGKKDKKVKKHKLKRTFAKKEDGKKGKGKGKGKDKKKGRGKGEEKKKDEGPCGPDLPRERVTKAPVTGKLLCWRRVFGWVRASEEIDHEDAKKRK